MQLYFVYWDMSRCLRTLTNTLEENNYVANDIQNKLRRKMAHLVLVREAKADPRTSESAPEQGSEEHRPLLVVESEPSSSRTEELKELSANYSLIPDASLPAQTKAYQLLMTYSAVYMKLLMSQRLSAPSHHSLRSVRNHCTTAPFCLCQYIKKKVLQ
ncbi:unnamed protein product [Tetraodon nigroviridis]|uniref:(spotted green pufferfish) hypothetical protein n=1 Tax=Tetraodon nigroviridis TaxID=99883 RepID=Q4T485_TETNG|nr:unnamed protein product [Tetraodon nigroviridis]